MEQIWHDDLVCSIAVFAHGARLPAAIDRVRDALEHAMPAALRGRLVIQAASSMDPGADALGTLYTQLPVSSGVSLSLSMTRFTLGPWLSPSPRRSWPDRGSA